MSYLTIEAAALQLARKYPPSVDDLTGELERSAGGIAGQKLNQKARAKIRARAEVLASGGKLTPDATEEEKPALFAQFKADIVTAVLCGDVRAYNPRTHAPAARESVKDRAYYFVVRDTELDAWFANCGLEYRLCEQPEKPERSPPLNEFASVAAKARWKKANDDKEEVQRRFRAGSFISKNEAARQFHKEFGYEVSTIRGWLKGL